ncbi:MAG: WecB/TagA/CpsF family glycosyltransferase [Clostridiales bacterium]|nr:WecB/TagA/CpsF family glycosyltransferase [Clostridiales bacterium]
MDKTIDVAGISLDNYAAHELLDELEQGVSGQGFCTIEEVNTDTIMLADTDDSVREMLGLLDHTVICETGILEAIGKGSGQRRREIEHHVFFRALLRQIERSHRTLYLIAESRETAARMDAYVREHYPQCEIIGVQALDGWDGAADPIVNEINAATPDVILSVLPSPMQEQFLLANRDKLSAGLWYGIGALRLFGRGRPLMRKLIQHFVRTHRLEKKVRGYRQEN